MLDQHRDAAYDMLAQHMTKRDFDKRWSIMSSLSLLELVAILQPLVYAMHSKPTLEVQIDYVMYMSKWISLGYDASYFTSGAGAPGSCMIT